MVQAKYAIRKINVQAHGYVQYLCKHEDDVYFSYADYPTDVFYFARKEDAVDYVEHKNLNYCEIVEVYINEKV
jgi:hypothetical protein